MIRRILILLAALTLCLSGQFAFAEEAFEAGELHVYRVSMEENETVPVRWYRDTPSFPFIGIRVWYQMLSGTNAIRIIPRVVLIKCTRELKIIRLLSMDTIH